MAGGMPRLGLSIQRPSQKQLDHMYGLHGTRIVKQVRPVGGRVPANVVALRASHVISMCA